MAPLWALQDVGRMLASPFVRLLPAWLIRLISLPVTLPWALFSVPAQSGALAGWLWTAMLTFLVVEKAVWVTGEPIYSSLSRGITSASQDGLSVALICCLLALSVPFRNILIRLLIRLPAVAVVLAMAGDLAVRKVFAFRLSWDDVPPYLDPDVAFKIASATPVLSIALAVALGLPVLLALTMGLGRSRVRTFTWLGSFGAVGLLAYALTPSTKDDTYSWHWQNLLVYNLARGVDRPLTTKSTEYPYYADYLPRCGRLSRHLRPLLPRNKIILLVLESWTPSQSRAFSGEGDWTPELDRIAGRGWSFLNFHANGFNTADGLVALLEGEVPVRAPLRLDELRKKWRQAPQFWQVSGAGDSLLNTLTRRNWQSYFLTSGRTGFSGKGDWLTAVGFQSVEGSESAFYDGLRHYVFDGASDEHLYRRALEVIGSAREPWFMTLETISTHPPYKDPVSGEHSLEKTVRYADSQVGSFVKELDRLGFFAYGGLLVVTSDHRSMTRFSDREWRRWREGAESRIPLIVYAGEDSRLARRPRISHERFQQIDLNNSLRSLVDGRSCVTAWQGDVLNGEPAQCGFFVPAGNRNYLYLNCGTDFSIVALDGDRSAAMYDAKIPDWVLPHLQGWRAAGHELPDPNPEDASGSSWLKTLGAWWGVLRGWLVSAMGYLGIQMEDAESDETESAPEDASGASWLETLGAWWEVLRGWLVSAMEYLGLWWENALCWLHATMDDLGIKDAPDSCPGDSGDPP